MGEISTIERQPKPIDEARHQLTAMEPQFKAALPAHIPSERFGRVVMTAIQNNPNLLKCDRRSLWNAAMRAAQDGLLPDGRDGAIVEYKGKAQWMPMIGGIRKKARNTGEISTWEAYCVYENDEFAFELGDEPFIKHRPALADPGKIIAAYSIATLKDGSKSREVMSISAIEGVRGKSQAKNGPWSDPIFYPEMVRKTVARRHAKVLPMSSDLDDLIRRDDDLYELSGKAEDGQPQGRAKPTLTGALDNLAKLPSPATQERPTEQHDVETGEVIEGTANVDPADDGIPASLRRDANNNLPNELQTLLGELPKLKSNQLAYEWAMDNIARLDALNESDRNTFDAAFIKLQETFGKTK